ncbi:hypothetical protein [Sphingosinicella microcystinivorans]|nr:hypothetical protein [Sphingosinicella microcystinivorans]WBX82489.1 hypothetical protein PE061_11675 [Sphingosinicella microcystinivorans]
MSEKIDNLQIALRAFATSANAESGLKKSKRKKCPPSAPMAQI